MVDNTLVILFILHFVGDFVLQTDKMALNKSKSKFWLTVHCCVYFLMFTIWPLFAVYLGLSHWLIDYFSSKVTSKLWSLDSKHWFFVTIGLDQLLHTLSIIFFKEIFL